MAVVRQMPELYLRGSLANITMKNLTAADKEHIERTVEFVAKHAELQGHRINVTRVLSVTIGGDYADDQAAAEEEYKIAIWRAVVDLFHHRSYTFKCTACGSLTYMTKRMRPKAIDRIQTPCPNCQMIEIADPGDVPALQKLCESGNRYITESDYQDSYKNLPDHYRAPTCKSTINYIAGERKYDNPQAVIDDDRQLRKFFGEYIWNYFRQHINENKRKEHRKTPQIIKGPADWVILQEILCLCSQMEVDFNYCPKTEPKNGIHTIHLFGLLTPPEFTAELAILRAKAWLHRVKVNTTHVDITVEVGHDTTEITAEIIKPEHVSVLDTSKSSDDQANDFTVSQISYRTVGGTRMDLDDHEETVDNSEVMVTIRDSLPDGYCRDVFDILSQQGETYAKYSEKYGDGETKIGHIADFLGITTRAVNGYKQTIELHMLANHLVPSK